MEGSPRCSDLGQMTQETSVGCRGGAVSTRDSRADICWPWYHEPGGTTQDLRAGWISPVSPAESVAMAMGVELRLTKLQQGQDRASLTQMPSPVTDLPRGLIKTCLGDKNRCCRILLFPAFLQRFS